MASIQKNMTYAEKLETMEKLNRIRKYLLWDTPIESGDDARNAMRSIKVIHAAQGRLFAQGGAIWHEAA